jgi:hypothetical protein
MELFTITIDANTIIYHGSEHPIKNLQSTFMWFSMNETTANKYGNNIYKFTLNRQLKLINIQSGIFQLHLMDQLNIKYTLIDDTTNFVNSYKSRIMSALGMPNINEVIRVYGKPKCQYDNDNVKNITVANVPYFQHERWSKYEVDQLLMTEIHEIYSKYGFDGYISPTTVPSRLMCGWHHEEIGLFDPTNKFIPTSQSGGKITWDPSDFTKPIRHI